MVTNDQALQFAIILSSGIPGAQAIRYFYPDEENASALKFHLDKWMKSDAVQKEILKLQGKAWEAMTLDEKINFALDKSYVEMAAFLYTHNYSEVAGADKTKYDTCRQVLETKLAGMAGKMDALSQFWADLTSGKIKPLTAGKGPVAVPAAELVQMGQN